MSTLTGSDYPRVLVISSSVFNRRTGAGVTLSNLFEGWPRERIAIAHSDQEAPDFEICDQQFRLRAAELGWIAPFAWFPLPRRYSQSFSPNSANGNRAPHPGAGVGMGADSRLLSAARFLKNSVAKEGLKDRAKLTPRLREWILNFKPDVIYTLLGTLGYLRLVKQVERLTGARAVVHIMDDWPAVTYRQGLLSPWFRRMVDRELRDCVERAAVCMSICPSMDMEYRGRYGRRFYSFSNAIDIDEWSEFSCDLHCAARRRVVYGGSILKEAQLLSLLDVCAAVDALAEEGIAIEMEIRTSSINEEHVRREFARFRHVHVREPLPHEEVPSFLRQADVLVLPVNFDAYTTTYVRYSSPTKLPGYLMSGTPILVYGPRGVDQVERALSDGWGRVVHKRDVEALKAALLELATDKEYRSGLVRRAREVARRDHDIRHVRPAFQQLIREAAVGIRR